MARVEGLEELERNMAKLAKTYSNSIKDAMLMSGYLISGDAIKSIQAKSPGETVTRYREGGASYTHVAANEGQAPNTDTGRLVSSIFVETEPDAVYVGSSLDYAGWLEFGTSQMGARPWLIPAKEKNQKKIMDLIYKAVK